MVGVKRGEIWLTDLNLIIGKERARYDCGGH